MGGSHSQSSVVNETTDMVSDILINVSLSCDDAAFSEQSINITCLPFGPGKSQSTPYESNARCVECYETLLNRHTGAHDFQRRQWSGTRAGVNKPIDEEFHDAIQAAISCGKNSCKACNFENISQKTVISAIQSCSSFNTIKNSINQKLANAITQKLVDNKSFLAPLTQMLGARSSENLVTNLTNRISSLITEDLISKVSQQIDSFQTLNLQFTDGSNDVNGLSQNSAFHAVSTYLGKSKIFNQMFTDEQWRILQQNYNEQNTIGELGNEVVKEVNDINAMFKSIMGKVVIFIFALTGLLFGIIVVMVIVRYIQKATAKSRKRELTLQAKESQKPWLQQLY